MYKADENFYGMLFLSPLQMGVEGTDEGASGAQHSRKLVSFTLSGKKDNTNMHFTNYFYKKIINRCSKNL